MSTAPPELAMNPNTDFLAEMDGKIKSIDDCVHFSDLVREDPRGLGDGGSAKAFNFDDFKTGLATSTSFVCCGNAKWVNPKYTTAPGVPVLKSAVVDYANKTFMEAVLCVFCVVVGVVVVAIAVATIRNL